MSQIVKHHTSTQVYAKLGNSLQIIKYQISENNKLLFYIAYIFTQNQYVIEVYGQASTSTFRKVQIQKN